MTDLRSTAHEYEPFAGAPRCIFIRAGLENARVHDRELCRMASPPDRAENDQAIAISEVEAAAAPPKELIPPRRGHQDARYWLQHTEVNSQALTYTSREPHITATFCAAEPQVSEPELHICGLASSANELIAGWWKGRQLGRIKFLASAAKRNAASPTLNGAYRRAWGLEPRATLDRALRAIKDMKEFPSSLHVAAWKLGDWPALLTGTQAAMSFGWIVDFLFSFCRASPGR